MITQQDLLDPIEFVSTHSQHVSIDNDSITSYVENFSLVETDHWIKVYPLTPLPSLSLEKQIDLFFLMGNQAFCFWGDPKWRVQYKGISLDGWWAMVACFHRAIEQGVPILDGAYLQNLGDTQMRSFFEGVPEIPLFYERHEMLRSIGKMLVEHYDGHFHSAFAGVPHDALSILELVGSFPGFDDVPVYKGREIPFYKKAQVVVSDLDEILRAAGMGGFTHMDRLPGHADYKIPALLRSSGILRYSDELSALVDAKEELPSGSELEVEIRANQLWAIHTIVGLLQKKYPTMTASTFNGILWVQSQTKKPNERPYHRTRTIYY